MVQILDKNDKNEILCNVHEAAREAVGTNCADHSWRYNGGWTKKINGIDKSKTDGYSLIGPFIDNSPQWINPGLYLDCNMHGSRKHPEKSYTLFTIDENGNVETINRSEGGTGWAVFLWPYIENVLAKKEDRKIKLENRKNALLEELKLIEEELNNMEN